MNATKEGKICVYLINEKYVYMNREIELHLPIVIIVWILYTPSNVRQSITHGIILQ